MASPVHWSRWGDPDLARALPEAVEELLVKRLGARAEPSSTVELETVQLPASTLSHDFIAEAVALLGAGQVRTDHETRVRHTGGKSTTDLLRIRSGDGASAPDAVLLPADHDEVLAVLQLCSRHRVAVVPFGGGTSVVGGLALERRPFTGVVALSLSRLDRMLSVDAESQTARLESGVVGPDAEALVAEHGFTIGHFPQSFERASIGGFAATRSSGQASAGYGRFDSMVVGLTAATPLGTLTLGRAPSSAAGPDLREVLLGSEGAFGVITSVTVRVRPLPDIRKYEAWGFPDFRAGWSALRRLAQDDGPVPTVLRLTDEAETSIARAMSGAVDVPEDRSRCLLIVGYEGSEHHVERVTVHASDILTAAGGTPHGAREGASWAAGRFAAPYLRDSLLDAGLLVETVETATFWSNLPDLYRAVRTALLEYLSRRETVPLVLCHISHTYATGASLYFTVVARQGDDPLAQWADAKAAASAAIVDAGGTITHHHAIGRVHRPWLEEEIGAVGVEILRAIKARIDPDGILNPGVLVP